MDLKERMKKFNQRWNITWNLKSHQDELKLFKTRVTNIFSDKIDECVSTKSKNLLCQYFGLSSDDSYVMNRYFKNLNDEIEVFKFLEALFSIEFHPARFSQIDGKFPTQEKIKEFYFYKLVDAVSFSNLNLSISMTWKGWEVIIYPKWEELLDEILVNNVLGFLSWITNEHFQSALNFHLAKDWIKVWESIRRTLEEFLREKFSNKKGLKANITELASFLKWANVPSQTKNIIGQTFSYLDDYFNDHTKHNDWNLDEYDAEFLIYQAWLLMRYISKVIK